MPALHSKYQAEFLTAVEERQHDEVERMLIKGGIHINREDVIANGPNYSGAFTPLMHASRYGDNKMVTLLLKYKANVNKSNTLDMTALHYAADSGHTETVVTLIQYNADVNKGDIFGYTPLHYAAMVGHTETVAALIRCNAVINQTDNIVQSTPLHLAARDGHTNTVLKLLQFGADVSLVNTTGTAQQYATARNHFETAQAIQCYIDKTANVNQQQQLNSENDDNAPMHDIPGKQGDISKTENVDICTYESKDSVIATVDHQNDHSDVHSTSQRDDVTMVTVTGNDEDKPTTHEVSMMCDETSPTTACSQQPVPNVDLSHLGYKFMYAPIWFKQDSMFFLQEVKLASNNHPCRTVGVPYKRIDDPNQYLDLTNAATSPTDNPHPSPPRQITGRPTEQYLVSLSSEIGFDWFELAIALGISYRGTQQIQMSFPHDGRRQVSEMLLQWRSRVQGVTEEERIEVLRCAVRSANRNDLANSIPSS